MDVFLRGDRDVVLEFLDLRRARIAAAEGTAVVPGHAIESMWFQIHIGEGPR